MHSVVRAVIRGNQRRSLQRYVPNANRSGGGSMSSTIREPDLEQYIRDDIPEYISISGELDQIRSHLNAGKNLLQIGPPATGKTLSFASIAVEREIPIITFDCARDTKWSDLIVKPWTESDGDGGEQTVYIPSIMPLGVLAANEYGEAIVVFEEVNVLPRYIQKNINQLTDWRSEVRVPAADETFELEDGSKLMIGGTMNPPGQGGTFELNPDFRDRFSELRRENPSGGHLGKILRKNGVPESLDNRDDIIDGQLVQFMQSMSSLYVTGKLNDYQVSVRDLVSLGQLWKSNYEMLTSRRDPDLNPVEEGLRMALRVRIYDKYSDDNERGVVESQIQKCFGVSVARD